MVAPEDLHTKESFINTVVPREHPYRERMWDSSAYRWLGLTTVYMYLIQREWRLRDAVMGVLQSTDRDAGRLRPRIDEMRTVFRLGGMIGMSIRLIDDILDGHACTPLPADQRPVLATGFIEAVADRGDSEEPEHDLRGPAYIAGRELHDAVVGTPAHPLLISRFERMRDHIVDEDKTHIDGYREAARADSELYAGLFVDALNVLEDGETPEELYDLAHGFGGMYGAIDDLVDDDISVDPAELRAYHAESHHRFRSHRGVLVRIMSALNYSRAPYWFGISLRRTRNRFRRLFSGP